MSRTPRVYRTRKEKWEIVQEGIKAGTFLRQRQDTEHDSLTH